MDVFKAPLAILLLAVVTSACNKTEPAQVFSLAEEKNCQEQRVQNEYLVRWKSGALTLEHFKGDHEKFIEEFIRPQLEKIDGAEYNHKVLKVQPYRTHELETDRFALTYNWGPEVSEADFAWKNNVTGEGILVAVIDDGVEIHHPQLSQQIYYNPGENGVDLLGRDKSQNGVDDDGNGYIDDFAGYNFAKGQPENENTGEYPYRGHGSHVTGIIAAHHEDQEIQRDKVQGMAPGAKILPLDFIDDDAGGTVLQAIEAIQYAVNAGAKIINASWGGPGCSVQLSQTIANLENQNVLFIAAAGNSGNDIDKLIYQEFPAAFIHPTQITVGSIGQSGYMAGHSNYGYERVNLFAPGDDIVSTVPPSGSQDMSGTSMATPHVSGAAALLWSYKPNATAQEIKSLLLDYSAQSSSYISTSRGRLNVLNSLSQLMNP